MFFGTVCFNRLSVGGIVRRPGVHLYQGEMTDAVGDLLWLEALFVPLRDAPHGDAARNNLDSFGDCLSCPLPVMSSGSRLLSGEVETSL